MRKIFNAAATLAVMGASVLFAAPSAGAADIPPLPNPFRFRNGYSGYCMADPGRSPDPGVQMIQWGCNSLYEQDWWVQQMTVGSTASDATYRIWNRHSKLCLAASGASKDPGAKVIQWGCNRGKEQNWYINNNRLRNANSSLCLAIPKSSTKEGAGLTQRACNGSDDQWWTSEKRPAS